MLSPEQLSRHCVGLKSAVTATLVRMWKMICGHQFGSWNQQLHNNPIGKALHHTPAHFQSMPQQLCKYVNTGCSLLTQLPA